MKEREFIFQNVKVIESFMPDRKMAAFSLWFVHGSGNEEALPAGISHFLEHMLFKGTEKINGTEAIEKIEILGGELNAFTTRHHICVYSAAPKETFPQVVELMLQMVFRPNWTESDFHLERNVIHNEIDDVLDTPEDYIEDEWYGRFIQHHPLGKPVLGTHQSLDKISFTLLTDFHHRVTSECRKTITVSGNFDSQSIRKLVQKYFPPQSKVPERKETEIPEFSKFDTIRRIDSNQAYLMQGLVAPNEKIQDYFFAEIANLILGNGMSSLLFNNIREKRGAAYSVYSYTDFLQGFLILGVYAASAPELLDSSKEGVSECLEQMANSNFLEKVVPDKMKQLRYNLDVQLDSPGKRMLWLGQMAVYYPDYREAFKYEEILKKIDATEAIEWILKHFSHIPPAKICLLPEERNDPL